MDQMYILQALYYSTSFPLIEVTQSKMNYPEEKRLFR